MIASTSIINGSTALLLSVSTALGLYFALLSFVLLTIFVIYLMLE